VDGFPTMRDLRIKAMGLPSRLAESHRNEALSTGGPQAS
jgi:hypothetical protein